MEIGTCCSLNNFGIFNASCNNLLTASIYILNVFHLLSPFLCHSFSLIRIATVTHIFFFYLPVNNCNEGDTVDAVVPYMGESISDGTLATLLKSMSLLIWSLIYLICSSIHWVSVLTLFHLSFYMDRCWWQSRSWWTNCSDWNR